ncbi:MAG: porphobilinogen synthase [Elusimicrobia bacterium]|nr:porphobilinogen synthase [Elusimicrobiota bacterium]
MSFPSERLRRLRRTPILRALVCETTLEPSDLVLPLFVRPGKGVKRPIKSMPGHFQCSIDQALKAAASAAAVGVRAVILFGIPDKKDSRASGAYARDGIVQRAAGALKSRFPDLAVIADLCFCEYMDHGHCGVVKGGEILNDATLELTAKTAVSQAEAGCDMIAPSGMMDGQVAAIRKALDGSGLGMTAILAYAAKYASAFYGPFREAAESPPRFGDRASYQMDPSNLREALREVGLDIQEGADIVMVKPALAYLDVLRRVKDAFRVPCAAYSVSGEYSMIKAGADKGWIDERKVAMEALLCIKRAGADLIITYHAVDAARWLHEKK